MGFHFGQFDIISHPDITDVVKSRRLRYLFERVLAVLDLGVVGCDAIADESIRYRKLLVHVNHGILVLAHESVRRVEACRSRANDGNAEAPPNSRGCAECIAKWLS